MRSFLFFLHKRDRLMRQMQAPDFPPNRCDSFLGLARLPIWACSRLPGADCSERVNRSPCGGEFFALWRVCGCTLPRIPPSPERAERGQKLSRARCCALALVPVLPSRAVFLPVWGFRAFALVNHPPKNQKPVQAVFCASVGGVL